MTRRLIAFLLALATWTFTANAAQKVDTLRVLAIGNSFSEDAVEQNLHEIAAADGRCCAIVGNMYIGGCSLERHWNNMKNDAPAYRYRKVMADGKMVQIDAFSLAKALADDNWDVISLQQASPLSGKWESYEPFLGELLDFIKANSRKDVRLMWHQTWAYNNFATHGAFPNYNMDQWLMYNSIMDASAKACQKYGLEIIPCGTAIQNLRCTYVGDNVTRDGFHLNHAIGRYTAACTWFSVVFRRRIIGNSWITRHLTHEYQTLAQEAAYEAVCHPYKVSSIGHTEVPESYVPDPAASVLPDPLLCNDGKKVKNVKQWEKKRRAEIFEVFETEVYGKAPGRPETQSFEVLDIKTDALNGLATRKRVAVYFDAKKAYWVDMLLYIPNGTEGPVPVFLGINGVGNAALTSEEDVYIPEGKNRGRYAVVEQKPRGSYSSSLPLQKLLESGYAVATFFCGDVDPDFDDTYGAGIHKLYFSKGQKFVNPDEWGSIAAWSWGLSRAMDYLETDSAIAAGKVAVIGHYQFAKAALWAAALDQRFAMVAANASACGGAALSRRAVGETVANVNNLHPNWFCDNFKKYGNWESGLGVDQHELIALIAPRPVCIGDAEEDLSSDPEGECLALEAAAPVYKLYKAENALNYHCRKGVRALLEEDWDEYIKVADRFLK